jgi:hypothetical protein
MIYPTVSCPTSSCRWYGKPRAVMAAKVGPDLLQAGPVVCAQCGAVQQPVDEELAKPVSEPGTF